jgi:hypothetical protein
MTGQQIWFLQTGFGREFRISDRSKKAAHFDTAFLSFYHIFLHQI